MLAGSVTRKGQKQVHQLSLLDLSVILPIVDFQLSPVDLPSLSTYEAADLTQKPRVGSFWPEAERIKTLDGKIRFSTLCKLMYGFLWRQPINPSAILPDARDYGFEHLFETTGLKPQTVAHCSRVAY